MFGLCYLLENQLKVVTWSNRSGSVAVGSMTRFPREATDPATEFDAR
jgi:hypothetical protein